VEMDVCSEKYRTPPHPKVFNIKIIKTSITPLKKIHPSTPAIFLSIPLPK